MENNILNKNRRLILSGLFNILPVIFLVILWCLAPVYFDTEDDTELLYSVAGYRTGTPSIITHFCGIIWGLFLSSLYRITGSISWYAIINLWLIVCSIYVLWNMIDISQSQKLHKVLRYEKYIGKIVFFFFLFWGILCFYSTAIQFTMVSAFCGMAAIIFAYKKCAKRTQKSYAVELAVFSVFILCCYNIRSRVGLLMLLSLSIYLMGGYNKANKKNVIKYLIIAYFECAISFAVNTIWKNSGNWYEYDLLRDARVKWLDFPHLTFENYPDLYQSKNWSLSLYNLVGKWFFLDNRVTADNFNFFNNAYKETIKGGGIFGGIARGWYFITETRSNSLLFVLCVLFVVSLFLSGVLLAEKKRRELLISILSLVMFLIITGYFMQEGRYPYRLAMALVVLFLIPGFVIMFNIISTGGKRIVVIVFLAFTIICFKNKYSPINRSIEVSNSDYVNNSKMIREDMENYVISNPNNLYIYDVSLALAGDPFSTHSEKKPSNLIFWGGPEAFSPLYYEQLKINHKSQLNSEVFIEENVCFMGSVEPDKDLISYMKEQYEDCECEIVDQQMFFVVYRFIRK